MTYKSDIQIVPTLEELQQSLLAAENLLADLHENGECLDSCILCQQIGNESYVWEMDEMLKSHLSTHPRRVRYPYLKYCDYCRADWWISKNKEYTKYEH